jgi:hypothetical protein
MLALIDADTIVYRAAFGAQKTVYNIFIDGELSDIVYGSTLIKITKRINTLKEEFPTSEIIYKKEIVPMSEQFALDCAKNLIVTVLGAVNATSFKCYLTAKNDTTLFRRKLATIQPYKGNRKDFVRPVHYDAIRAYLKAYWRAEIVTGIEADDALSMEQHKHLYWEEDDLKCDSIIISIDKDLLQVPGAHYNFHTETFTFIDPLVGLKNLYKQTLTGDNADHIPGVNGVGPKTAEKLVEKATTEEELATICKSVYNKHNRSIKDFEEVYRLCKLIESEEELQKLCEF